MRTSVEFVLDGATTTISFDPPSNLTPTTTVLNYLRSLPIHKGVKEGCAEGDCGACTVVLGELTPGDTIRYRSVDSCLVFLPMIHGKQLVTVENLKNNRGVLHPVQQAMVDTNGSQCGFCTPGIVMALFSLYKSSNKPTRVEIDDALTGNLCRCTGYKPIIEAAAQSCVANSIDHFTASEPEIARLLKAIPATSLRLKTGRQKYFQPATLAEALSLRAEYPDANVINGATDIALRVTKNHELLETIIDLCRVKELKEVSTSSESITIGAGVPLSEVMRAVQEILPALRDTLAVFGSQQIRNLATLGGNIGTASPIGDTLSALIAYNASLILQDTRGRRELPLDGFITGYRQTQRRPDELIIAVKIPLPESDVEVRWYKVSKRKDLDISTVSAGFRLEMNGGKDIRSIKLVYGGMAERVKRATTAEEFLAGRRWDRSTVEEAMMLIDNEFAPISDARSSAEFRRIAARNLLLKFWSETSN